MMALPGECQRTALYPHSLAMSKVHFYFRDPDPDHSQNSIDCFFCPEAKPFREFHKNPSISFLNFAGG